MTCETDGSCLWALHQSQSAIIVLTKGIIHHIMDWRQEILQQRAILGQGDDHLKFHRRVENQTWPISSLACMSHLFMSSVLYLSISLFDECFMLLRRFFFHHDKFASWLDCPAWYFIAKLLVEIAVGQQCPAASNFVDANTCMGIVVSEYSQASRYSLNLTLASCSLTLDSIPVNSMMIYTDTAWATWC